MPIELSLRKGAFYHTVALQSEGVFWLSVLLCFSVVIAEDFTSTDDDYEYVSNPIKDTDGYCSPSGMGEPVYGGHALTVGQGSAKSAPGSLFSQDIN